MARGCQRKERVDRLASVALKESSQVNDRADILNALRKTGREQDSSDKCDSVTLTRLQELQVKRGAAKQEHYAGSQRKD